MSESEGWRPADNIDMFSASLFSAAHQQQLEKLWNLDGGAEEREIAKGYKTKPASRNAGRLLGVMGRPKGVLGARLAGARPVADGKNKRNEYIESSIKAADIYIRWRDFPLLFVIYSVCQLDRKWKSRWIFFFWIYSQKWRYVFGVIFVIHIDPITRI